MLDIGLEIKILRERLRMSSKELAERIGLSQSQMSRLEKGQRRIDTTVLHRISEALGVDPAIFFRESPADSATGAESAAPPEAPIAARIRFDHLGKLVRSERRKRHLTVDELATKVGRTRAYMTALEEGRHALDAELADKICRALKLSPNFFVSAQTDTIDALETQIARLDQALAEIHRDGGPGAGGDSGATNGTHLPLFGTLGAGLTFAFDEDDYPIGEPESFLRLPGLDTGRFFAVTLGDDSMASTASPSFREGDIVVLGCGITRSRDFVLAKLDDGSLVFRQVFFEPEGRVRLQPLNLEHTALSRPRGKVRSMWNLVLHVGRV